MTIMAGTLIVVLSALFLALFPQRFTPNLARLRRSSPPPRISQACRTTKFWHIMMDWLLGIPKILSPSFTWPHRALGSVPLASTIPSAPRLTHRTIRRLVGFLHSYLPHFSHKYCAWTGIKYDNQILQLPFGLIVKWSDGTRLEEVIAMKIARSAGLPVPMVLAYGEHPDTPHAPVSILMTRLPGKELGQIYETLSEKEQQTVLDEMQTMLNVIRSWPNPWLGTNPICSVTRAAIRSVRVPNHLIGPCESESQFNDDLIRVASDHSFPSRDAFLETVAYAKKMHTLQHPIVFSHGDLKHHNVLVHDGHVSGFIDWESAGWYPDYWEFTTAMRFCPKDFWWYGFVSQLGGAKYMDELEIERALTSLTVDSYAW